MRCSHALQTWRAGHRLENCWRLTPLDQRFAAKLHHESAAFEVGKRVVLLGGQAGHRLKPVREMRGATLNGPFLHRIGDLIGEAGIQFLPLLDARTQRAVCLLWHSNAHLFKAKNVGAEQLRNLLVTATEHNGGLVGHRLNSSCARGSTHDRYLPRLKQDN